VDPLFLLAPVFQRLPPVHIYRPHQGWEETAPGEGLPLGTYRGARTGGSQDRGDVTLRAQKSASRSSGHRPFQRNLRSRRGALLGNRVQGAAPGNNPAAATNTARCETSGSGRSRRPTTSSTAVSKGKPAITGGRQGTRTPCVVLPPYANSNDGKDSSAKTKGDGSSSSSRRVETQSPLTDRPTTSARPLPGQFQGSRPEGSALQVQSPPRPLEFYSS